MRMFQRTLDPDGRTLQRMTQVRLEEARGGSARGGCPVPARAHASVGNGLPTSEDPSRLLLCRARCSLCIPSRSESVRQTLMMVTSLGRISISFFCVGLFVGKEDDIHEQKMFCLSILSLS